MTSNLSCLSVAWRQFETNPKEIAADHCWYSCWYSNNQFRRNFAAEEITAWADGGATWAKQETIHESEANRLTRNKNLRYISKSNKWLSNSNRHP